MDEKLHKMMDSIVEVLGHYNASVDDVIRTTCELLYRAAYQVEDDSAGKTTLVEVFCEIVGLLRHSFAFDTTMTPEELAEHLVKGFKILDKVNS